MGWQDKISSCFGSEDKKFALHPCDLVRAAELLVDVLNENVTWSVFEIAIRDHLKNIFNKMNNQKSLETHINEQIVRVKALFLPWIA